jgi:hypothetical protein
MRNGELNFSSKLRVFTFIAKLNPIPSWHAVIGDPTYADAILDRL